MFTAFNQPAGNDGEHLESNVDVFDHNPSTVCADDFVSDGRVISTIRFWGGALPPPVEPCSLTNGGFETGDFGGWVALDNGIAQNLPWTVGPAGTCVPWVFLCNAPLAGADAVNGFDGEAGLLYEIYQDVFLPFGAIVTLTTHHRIQYDSYSAPSTLPRELEITVRDTANSVLEVLYHEDVFLNGAPYTDLGWNERVFNLSAYAGSTVRIHFKMLIPESSTGPAMIEFDDLSITCTGAGAADARLRLGRRQAWGAPSFGCGPDGGDCCTANGSPGCQDVPCCAQVCALDPFCCDVQWDDICASVAVALCATCADPGATIIDGWMIGLHAVDAGTPGTGALGVYFCSADVVHKLGSEVSACDVYAVTEYEASLADCCLVAWETDVRDGTMPAQPDGMHPSRCRQYAVSIEALVGRRYDVQAGVAVPVGQWNEYPGEYGDVCAGDGWAFVSNATRYDSYSARVYILNIQESGQPQFETTYFIPAPNDTASPDDIELWGDLLFVALAGDGNDGVAVVDVRDPSAPVGVATIRVPGFEDVRSICVLDGMLYMANESGRDVAIVEVSVLDPDAPPPSTITAVKWIISDAGVSAACHVVVRGDRLFVSACADGLRVYDVSDVQMAPPVLLGSMTARRADVSWPTADTGQSRFVVTAEHQAGGGLTVYELEQVGPNMIFTIRDHVALGAEAFSADRPVIVGDRVYASWSQAGLRVFDLNMTSGRLSPVAQYDTNPLANTGAMQGGRGIDPSLGGERVLITDSTEGLYVIDTTAAQVTCLGSVTGRVAEAPFWSWLTTASGAGPFPARVGGVVAGPGDSWTFDGWQAVVPDCGLVDMAFELLTSDPDPGVVCGCTVADACGDANACTQDICNAGECAHTPRRYGDVNASGFITLVDLFCVLDAFQGDFTACAFVNSDIHPCTGNGVIGLFDLFAVLDAFGGEDACNCPAP